VCHFHLLRDIGEDLYAQPQAALSQRVRQLKLQPRLREQRKGQTQWLREHVEQPTVLAEALRGGVAGMSQETLGREVLLAFHQWMLDYASDGQRQGFPFDPYLLYFHRRVVRATASVGQLLSNPQVRQRAPQVLINFEKLLREYVSDSKVIAAASEYEEAFALFVKLRMALRLGASGDQPLRDRYLLEDSETNQVRQSLATLREDSRVQAEAAAEESSRRCHAIVVQHLDRYWDCLFARSGGANRDRTTNGLESHWGRSKRLCRKRHGRDKLTRDFQSLPPEFMLVINLENPSYVELGGKRLDLAQLAGADGRLQHGEKLARVLRGAAAGQQIANGPILLALRVRVAPGGVTGGDRYGVALAEHGEAKVDRTRTGLELEVVADRPISHETSDGLPRS
jgi:hypothetical protein